MRAWWVVNGLAGFAALGCSLLVDTSELDEGCPRGQKLCSGRCVSEQDPAYGCNPALCTPCALEHAIPACSDGACVVGACLYGYGCERCSANLLTEEANCGECGKVCSTAERCLAGTCTGCALPCEPDERCLAGECVAR
jgi:hypothetical protein